MSPDAIELAKSFSHHLPFATQKKSLCVILHSLHFKVSHSTSLYNNGSGWNGRKIHTFKCDRNPFKVMSWAAAAQADWLRVRDQANNETRSHQLPLKIDRRELEFGRQTFWWAHVRKLLPVVCWQEKHTGGFAGSPSGAILCTKQRPLAHLHICATLMGPLWQCNPNFKPCRALE